MKPDSFKPSRHAAVTWTDSSADELPSKPMTGIAGRCALAASGHATAAPPSRVMNSRRFMLFPRLRKGILYQIPGILTRCGFPNQRDSDSKWRTKEVRHVDSDTVAWGFQGLSATRLGAEDEERAAGPA